MKKRILCHLHFAMQSACMRAFTDIFACINDVAPDCAGATYHIAWSGKRGSNPRPSAWEADALPLSYCRIAVQKYK